MCATPHPDCHAKMETPTSYTEALTLRWLALMPALGWRLRQPNNLLPWLKSLDLSHNNLRGEDLSKTKC